jgi:hypothetical protein
MLRLNLRPSALSLCLAVLVFVTSAASAQAQTVSITGHLPDPSSGNTYCFKLGTNPDNYYNYTINATGVSSTDYIGTYARIYSEAYNSSGTLLAWSSGPGDLAWWPIISLPGASSLNVNAQSNDGPIWNNGDPLPTGTSYVIYGVQVEAYVYNSGGTSLVSTVWNTWSNGAFKATWNSTTSQWTSLGGWYSFHYTPYWGPVKYRWATGTPP